MNPVIRSTFLALALASSPACSSSTGTPEQCGSSSCVAGELCVDGSCRKLCATDFDCAATQACVDDVCAARGGVPPLINSIDADGVVDADPTHVPHRIASRLTVNGENLTGATVELSGAGGPWVLEVCSETDNQLEVVLPQGLVSGSDYVLSVATQAGTCSSTLPVLQGERPQVDVGGGLTGDGSMGAPLAVDFSTHTHTASQLTDGTANFAANVHSHLIGDLPGAAIQGMIDGTLADPTTPTRLQTNAVVCDGSNDGVTWYSAADRLAFLCSGGQAVSQGGLGYRGCKEIFDDNMAATNGVYWVAASPNPADATQVYCDVATLRSGTNGWMLLAVVSNNNGGFWDITSTATIIDNGKGVASPTSENYFMAIDWWRRFTQSQPRTIFVEIETGMTGYQLVYPGFQLDGEYRYRHFGSAVWQHNDPRNSVTFTGDLYPYEGSYAGGCADATTGGLGWWGSCGYSQFFQPDSGGAMRHPVSSAGSYVAITGVTSKRYWLR